MTHRLTVSLPDDLYASIAQIADGSNISAAAVVRSVLSDTVPKLHSVLAFLGTVTPDQAEALKTDLDVWSQDMRRVMHDAPEALGDLRNMLDATAPDADE